MSKPRYEFDSVPDMGTSMQIGDGLHWLRMSLPISLNHINLWLLEDDDGWSIVDTGMYIDDSKDAWRSVFEQTFAGNPVNRVIATHLHPDHVGCAGWLTHKLDAELWMTRDEYLLCRVLVSDTGRKAPEEGIRFYRGTGFSEESLDAYQRIFGFFGKFVSRLPESYHRLIENDVIATRDREWRVIIGRGHSPEHACLYDEQNNVLISGDQLLPTISSNVSVYPTEPDANPLRWWLESLEKLKNETDPDVLVLPAHGKPFRGAHDRLDTQISEHRERLEKLLDFCKDPVRAVDAFPVLFRREIQPDSMIMATGESLAHLHYLWHQGDLTRVTDKDGINWFRAS